MGTRYCFPEPSPETIDPGDVDLARRLAATLHRRGIIQFSDDELLDIARELSGVDPYWA